LMKALLLADTPAEPQQLPPGADDKVSNVHLAVGLRQWELGTTGSKV
jgi:hypothetical protein